MATHLTPQRAGTKSLARKTGAKIAGNSPRRPARPTVLAPRPATPDPKQIGASLDLSLKEAGKAFAKFSPSRFTAGALPRNFLPAGGDLAQLQKSIFARGIEQMQKSTAPRALRLAKTPELTKLIQTQKKSGSSPRATIDPAKLQTYLDAKLANPHLFAPPLYTRCKAQIEADRLARKIAGEKETAPPAPNAGSDGQGSDGEKPTELTAEGLVHDHVARQMGTATSPESQLRYSVDRSKQVDELGRDIQTFQLRTGPADTIAYHDFHTLQIAFEDVWTELWDDEVASLGRQLYQQYVQFKQPLGLNGGGPSSINTLEDLRQLMKEINGVVAALPGKGSSGFGFSFGGVNLGGVLNPGSSSSSSAIPDTSRLAQLLQGLQNLLSGEYAFKVFAEKSINFGVLVTYRQKWEPLNYQVGDLISTVPLAPKEIRRYTTRTVTKKTRAVKELEDALRVRRKEEVGTSRVDAEIVQKAQNKTNFQITAHESIGEKDSYQIESTQTSTQDQAKQSEQTKKDIRENVLKSIEEYKQENKKEIETNVSEESETTNFQELQNPNDELPVTYLFYELQRQYRISEKLRELTPVILVANHVPWPHEITDAWLVQHDWILKRVILDDSFRPALEFLSKSFVGADINIRVLEENLSVQRNLVQTLNRQIQLQNQVIDAGQKAVKDAVQGVESAQQAEATVDLVKDIFDPLGITGDTDLGVGAAAQTRLDFAKDQLERAEKERRRLESQLELATTALQAAVDRLSAAIKEHYDQLTGVDRLRVHVRENILYYMQAIWSQEPPDQRYFRLYDLEVPVFVATGGGVAVQQSSSQAWQSPSSGEFVRATMPAPEIGLQLRRLADVADLDKVLGYKGNYAIYPLKQNNALTLHMMQDFLEIGDEVRLRDPDEFGNYTLEEMQELAACVYRDDPAGFKKVENTFKQAIIDRLMAPRSESELVVVPTSSIYIEALVGTHPLLEDFKLIHRALDVKKVQAEVRRTELENVRLAARALKGKVGDPDIDKQILIRTDGEPVAIQPDTG